MSDVCWGLVYTHGGWGNVRCGHYVTAGLLHVIDGLWDEVVLRGSIFRLFFYKCILGFFEFCVLAFIVLAFIVLLPRPHSILIIPSMCLYWWYCPPTCWLLYVRILPGVLTQYASAHFDFTHRYIYNILYFDVKFLGVTFSAYSEF